MKLQQAVPQRERERGPSVTERFCTFIDRHPHLTTLTSAILAGTIVAQCSPLFSSRFSVSEADIRKACGLITDPNRATYREGMFHIQTGSTKHIDDVDNGIYNPGLIYNNDLEVFHLDTRELDVLTDTPDVNETDAAIFNGKIVFVRNGQAVLEEKKDGEMQQYHRLHIPEAGVYMIDVDGRNERRIAETPNDGSSDNYPVLSPDGKLAAWTRLSKIRDEVYADNILVANLETGKLNQITRFSGEGRNFISRIAISPNSSKIAYISWDGVVVMDIDGGKPKKVTPSGNMDGAEGSDQEFRWLDDSRIVVLNQRRMNGGLVSEEFSHDMIFRQRQGVASVATGRYRDITGECYAITQE